MRCKTSAGYGENLRWKVLISGGSTGVTITNLWRPIRILIFTRVKSINGVMLTPNTQDRIVDSRGGESIAFVGENLGSRGQTSQLNMAEMDYIVKLSVQSPKLTQVTCRTVAGTGAYLSRLVERDQIQTMLACR